MSSNTTTERRSWGDLDTKTQASLLTLMPKDVQKRVRRGDMPSELEVGCLRSTSLMPPPN